MVPAEYVLNRNVIVLSSFEFKTPAEIYKHQKATENIETLCRVTSLQLLDLAEAILTLLSLKFTAIKSPFMKKFNISAGITLKH